MVALFVVLTFLLFILVDYFVLKAQGKLILRLVLLECLINAAFFSRMKLCSRKVTYGC